MKLVDYDTYEKKDHGGTIESIVAVIVSNTEPAKLPTKVGDIVVPDKYSIPADATFAPMSSIFVPSKGTTYIADEDGIFRKQ